MARITECFVARALMKLTPCNSPGMVRKFMQLGSKGHDNSCTRDVPKGHCAVYVGQHRSRFIIPTSFLNHSLFADLLQKSADEFGFDHHLGLIIPCDEVLFEQLTSFLSTTKKSKTKNSSTKL